MLIFSLRSKSGIASNTNAFEFICSFPKESLLKNTKQGRCLEIKASLFCSLFFSWQVFKIVKIEAILVFHFLIKFYN